MERGSYISIGGFDQAAIRRIWDHLSLHIKKQLLTLRPLHQALNEDIILKVFEIWCINLGAGPSLDGCRRGLSPTWTSPVALWWITPLITAWEQTIPNLKHQEVYFGPRSEKRWYCSIANKKRRRSACVSAQPDQHLCYLLIRKYYINACFF